MLSRLSLRGFKSFAEATSLELGPGVNVVVGPNGSGKSNLAEAVVWALGEQRAGRLRAGGMADVLYSGGAKRPAAQFAEVSLVLSDETGGSGGPAEVEASRRLTRAGDAHYRLNAASCRLLDVQEALAARGAGPDALAVIRQGQVEALCTSTPLERRAMVNAAAGVAVAKRRRRRAEQKLARVGDRLDRARDLAGEVRSRARALDRQARAAERAQALDVDIETARRAVSAARARVADQAHREAREKVDRLQAIAAVAAEALDRARRERSAAAETRALAGGDASRAQELATALRTAADRSAGRAELAAERVEAAEGELAQRARRRGAAAERLDSLAAAAAEAARISETAREDAERADAEAVEAESADVLARGEHRRLEDAAAAESSALLAAERQASETARSVEQARAALASAEARRAQLEADAVDAGALARAERRDEIASGRVARWSERLQGAERVAADAESGRAVADLRLREARVAARSLAPADAGQPSGGRSLGDGLEVEEGAERAVAAALGALSDAVPATTIASARESLQAGAVSAVVPAPPRAAVTPPSGARPVLDLVTACSDVARPHIDRLLADAWLVDDLGAVPPGATGVFVTSDGHALRPVDGVLTRSAGSWARRAMHGRAQEAERQAAEAVGVADSQARVAAAAVQDVRRRRRAAERSATKAAEALSRVRAQVGGRATRAAEAAEAVERLKGELGGLVAAAEAAGPRAESLRAAASAASAAAVAARAVAQEATATLRTASATAADARAALAAARAHEAEATARMEATRALALEPDDAADLGSARRAAAALEAVARVLAPAAARAADLYDEAAARTRDRDGDVAAADRVAEQAEAEASAASSQVHGAEVHAAVAAERAAEAGPPVDEAQEMADPDEAIARLADLERRRGAIGAVNPLAAAERGELDERETEMIAQIEDLEAAAESLRAHLSELDAAVAEGFDSLFDAFRERFTEVCGLLFPGGEGRLRAVVDDEGEAGIEVEVVPAGKRPRSLALLSGGERSLVALGFCLALAMARPAPFYLLDEVEAALDDANLRRFLGVVRRLSESTQFLLITHQQPTVEIADTIFGVTMGAEGVSQIVARRLRRDVEGPARPYVRRALHAIPGGMA